LRPSQFDPEQILAVREKFRSYDRYPLKGGKFIYISRSKAARRKVINDDDLVTLILNSGGEVVYMEDHDFGGQRKLMSECSVLISNHGAGLVNMIFMPDQSTIIELKADASNVNNCYFNLARALGHKYYYTINKGNNPDIQKSDIVVNIENLAGLLKKLS
jgi:capsular polysaccharide biosynthesis protein